MTRDIRLRLWIVPRHNASLYLSYGQPNRFSEHITRELRRMPADNQELDPQVIRTALGQDETAPVEARRAAFAELYLHYEPRVRHAVFAVLKKFGLGDLADGVCLKVWRRFLSSEKSVLSYYDPKRGAFSSFLSRIAYQQALQIMQSGHGGIRYTDQVEPIDDGANDRNMKICVGHMPTELYTRLLKQAVAEHEDGEQEIMREVYFNGRSALAVAATRDINQNAILTIQRSIEDKLHSVVLETGPKVDKQLIERLRAALAKCAER